MELIDNISRLLGDDLKQAIRPGARLKIAEQVTDQVTREMLRLLSVMQGDMSRAGIQERLKLKHLPHLRDAYLNPALAQGLVEMTIPDKPRSRLQKYRLTAAGLGLLQSLKR